MTDRIPLDHLTSDQYDALHDELAALRQVARGYCEHCGRGDAAPTVEDWERERQRANNAETELARLREGEEPAYAKHVMPTPGQWIWVWNRATPEERQRIVQAFLDDAAAASLCRFNGHAQRLEEDRKAWVIVARIRDVIADMEAITGARHLARILRRVVHGNEPAPASAATQATEGAVCTATLKNPEGRIFNCAQPAGHYDGDDQPDPLADDEPGGWHRSAPDAGGDRLTWADWATGTTPHKDQL